MRLKALAIATTLLTLATSAWAGSLHDAAKAGDRTALESLLTKDIDIDVPDSSGRSALYLAAEENHAEIVTLLAERGADPNRFISGFYTGLSAPIHAATRKGSVEAIRALAAAGADLTPFANEQGAPLHIAIEIGQDEVVEVLKSLGADSFAAPNVDQMIAVADIADGKSAAGLCSLCHALRLGEIPVGMNIGELGPSLWNIVGRKKAEISDYEYSEAMLRVGGDWTYSDLNSLIANPTAYVPGTKMILKGLEKPDKRAALIAYLRTLSENPVPLP